MVDRERRKTTAMDTDELIRQHREYLKDSVRLRLDGEAEFVLYLAPVGKKAD